MVEIYPILVLLAGLVLRIGIPVAFTAFLVFVFTRLDSRWQEATIQANGTAAAKLTPVGNCGCWDINGCPEKARKGCKAYNNQDIPCWQAYRSSEGLLKEKCLGCKVFQTAPIPA
jgi:hypothetical protein